MSPGMKFVDGSSGFALHHRDVRQLFLRVAREVLHAGVVLEHTAVDLEIRNAAGEGIGHGFEDEQ